jgi:hydroxymethylglutaryl-CoA synthase
MNSGIVSYGAYIPFYRIDPESIGRQWGRNGADVGKALGVKMKSVPAQDEDAATMAVEASRCALKRAGIHPQDIGAIFVGSESHPYAVKPTATIVGEALEATPGLMAADMEFACKAGTAGMQNSMGLVMSKMVKYALAIGTDTAQGAPGNALEYTAAAGAAAFIIGLENTIATINHTVSFTTDTPDFWRRGGMKYPSHGGRFTGQPAYFRHVVSCGKELFSLAGTAPEDYQFAVFHQPNSKFPSKAGKMLGFSQQQLSEGLIVKEIGNTYSAASMIGLASVLDNANPGDRIFLVSYGSGAGADGFDITVTPGIETFRKGINKTIREWISNYQLVDYGTYAKNLKKYKMEGE